MKKQSFRLVSSQVDFPALEEETLRYWKKNKIFEKSVQSRPANKTWTFLDGPPFITGLPHYGSLLSSIPKDLFPRYWTMKGYRVRRVWGWDCHGLPAENKVEEKLGIKRKKDIEEKVGVKKFIEQCKLYVGQVSSEWEWYVDHVGRWVDFKNAYRTMDLPYMETVMWVFKQMYEKGLVYKGLRVSLYCPHCSTPISNFEVAMDADNYQEITEPADVYKYQLRDESNTFLLAWSTTPWNKLATTALAVNPKLKYVKVKQGQENYVLAKETLKMLKDEPYEILAEFPGKDLVAKKFVPHYDFYKIDPGKRAFVVIGADFVTAEEGTGIVTVAAYGEEDLGVMQKENIQIVLHVDEEGRLKKEVPNWAGEYYLDVNPKLNEDLKSRGLLYREDPYPHTVPRCWRCQTRLYYAPQNAWFVDIQKLKKRLEETNETVNWFPSHFKYGRYLKSLRAAPDWCISRSRYWGSPVPVWECNQCGQRYVPGSIKELEKWSERKITDLHKPEIDEVTIKCQKCKGRAKRVPEVLDSWIEAGSAPFAERHFPFDGKLRLEEFFPPDFIVEYTGQIRAWFYVLHVIAVALYESKAFANVLVTGVILGTDGRKMSKNYGNYPDPKELLQKYGGDALRLYLLGSPVMRGEDILISEQNYKNQLRFLLTLWNIYRLFVDYASADKWVPSQINMKDFRPKNIIDRWILSRLRGNTKNMTSHLEVFDTVDCVGDVNYERTLQRAIAPLVVGNAGIFVVHDLSNWYVRRLRERVGPSVENSRDKEEAYQTMWITLTTYLKVLAPFIPFITEEVYRNLTGEESVHLTRWPLDSLPRGWLNNNLEEEMDRGMKLSSKIHAWRKEKAVVVKIPIKNTYYRGPKKLSNEVANVVKEEVNTYELKYLGVADDYEVSIDESEDNLDKEMGRARELVRQIQEARKEAGTALDEKITVYLSSWPKQYEEYIKKQTLADKLLPGDTLKIERHETVSQT